jgi:hypothetical protein
MRFLIFFFTLASGLAQIEHPGLGLMLDQNGEARPVLGVAGSVTLGDPIANDVQAVACSKRLCLLKTDASIVSSSGESADAPPGPALIAPPFIYFERTRQLARWSDGQLEPIDFAADGQILSLRTADDGAIELAVAHDDSVRIVRGDGAVVDSLPRAAGPVMLVKRGVIFANPDEVILRRADGTESRFDIADAESFFPLGEGYAGVRAGNSTWAIRIERGKEQAFLLPGAVP